MHGNGKTADFAARQCMGSGLASRGQGSGTGTRLSPDTPEPEPRFERFTATYPSGTVIPSFYAGGATLVEVKVGHPMAVVEAVEDSLLDVGSRT